MDGSGFLVDPRAAWSTTNSALTSLEDLQDRKFIGLLGVPGIGKSRYLKAEYQRRVGENPEGPNPCLWFDLSAFSTDGLLVQTIFNHETFLACRRSRGSLTLYLDSLDESQLNIRTVARLLGSELESHAWPELSVRVSCRTAVWPDVLERSAAKVWSDVGIYELQPLRRVDVAQAATLYGIEPEAFLEAVDGSQVGAFAARPVTLKFLLNLYTRSRELPGSRAEIYRMGLETLVDERSPTRRDSRNTGYLSLQERLALIEAIAAISVFCNHVQIWTGPHTDCPSNCISVDGLANAALALNVPFRGNATDAVREVLDTGVFSGLGPYRAGWAHESYREYLAAHFLADHCRSRPQLDSLITNPRDPEQKIPPQLYGTVGWLYKMNAHALSNGIEN